VQQGSYFALMPFDEPVVRSLVIAWACDTSMPYFFSVKPVYLTMNRTSANPRQGRHHRRNAEALVGPSPKTDQWSFRLVRIAHEVYVALS